MNLMKTHGYIPALGWLGFGFVGHLISTASAAPATGFEMSWWTVDGGGGVSAGGGFEIVGPRLTGGCWSIDPGFWGDHVAAPTLDTPALRIHRIGPDGVSVSFTPDCGDWVLQWARALATEPAATVWIDDPTANLMVVGDELAREFHVPSWGPRLFFRFRQP